MNARHAGSVFQLFEYCRKSGMLYPWLLHANESVFWTHMLSLDSALWVWSRGFLVTPRQESFVWFGAQKNTLRHLWSGVLRMVSAPENPYLHAPAYLNDMRNDPHDYAKTLFYKKINSDYPLLCS